MCLLFFAFPRPLTRVFVRSSALQYDPVTGKQLTAVKLPVQRPTACTFGAAPNATPC